MVVEQLDLRHVIFSKHNIGSWHVSNEEHGGSKLKSMPRSTPLDNDFILGPKRAWNISLWTLLTSSMSAFPYRAQTNLWTPSVTLWLTLLTLRPKPCIVSRNGDRFSSSHDSQVASVLDHRPRGRGFEPQRRPRAVALQLWASCSLHPGPGLTQPSILSGSVNEYRLRLGRYKAGMCDAAWCAPCTWVPLRWQCLLGAL